MVIMSRVSFYSSFLLLLQLVAAQSREFSNTSITPSMIILMIILVSFFFALGCVSIIMRKCLVHVLMTSDGGHHRYGDPENRLNVSQFAFAHGLDASVIESFPTFPYSKVKTLRIDKEALECPVCLNEFEDDETLRLIPKCCHVFHPGCIETWLRSQTTCPLCRANLVPVPGESVSFDISGLARETGQNSLGTLTDVNQRRVLASPDERLIDSVARTCNMPRKSNGISQSSSPGQPEDNLDRFTLRLPQDIHNQLVNSSLGNQGSKGHVALPQVRSSIRGYRTGSLGDEGNYFYFERFDQDGRFDRRPFSITPPFHTDRTTSPDGGDNYQERAGPSGRP